jgi:hypothetical protein
MPKSSFVVPRESGGTYSLWKTAARASFRKQHMKKTVYLFCFLLGFTAVSAAQKGKTRPKVKVDKFHPPSKKDNVKTSKTGDKKPPKVDLSNYKPPAKKE